MVSYKGFNYENKTYYTLEQLPNGLYNVGYNDKNTDKPTFEVKKEIIDNYKVCVTIYNIKYDNGYVDKWQVKYKLADDSSDDWYTSQDLSFNISEYGKYKIKIVNGNIESDEKEEMLLGEYSKSGLIAQYDGINNTRNGHDTNAKIWEDISGNNNDLMPAEGKFSWNQGSGWTDNGLELDGIDDYLYLDSNPLYDENNKAPDMTVEVISEKLQKTDGGPHSGYGMLISFGGIVNVTHFMDLWCVYCDDGTNRAYSIYENSLISDINTSEPNVGYGQTNAITYGKTGNKMFAYLNNVTREGKIVSGQTGKYTNICDKFDGWVIDDTKPNGVFYLGREHKSVPDTSKPTEINTEPIYFFKGIVKSVRIYNRALTQKEIQNNYQIDKERFGL